MIRAGARLNANDCNFGTPLHAATIMNHLDCVKLLLQAGMDMFLCMFYYYYYLFTFINKV